MSGEKLSRYVGAYFALLVLAWIHRSFVSGDWNNSAQIVYIAGGVSFCITLLPLLGDQALGAALVSDTDGVRQLSARGPLRVHSCMLATRKTVTA